MDVLYVVFQKKYINHSFFSTWIMNLLSCGITFHSRVSPASSSNNLIRADGMPERRYPNLFTFTTLDVYAMLFLPPYLVMVVYLLGLIYILLL